MELFEYCYAEMEKELESQGELIREEEADELYGVSPDDSKSVRCIDTPQESVDPDQWDVEADDSESERLPTDDILEANHVHEWFDEEVAHIWAHTDILDIIKMRKLGHPILKGCLSPFSSHAARDITALLLKFIP